MKKVLALSLVLVLFASLATIAEEAPKPDVTASKVKIKYFPQSQWKPTYMEVRTPAIMFCGQEVKTEFAKERLKIEGRNLKPSLEPVIFTIQKGEEERYLGIVHHEGKWVYYNATLEMVKHRKEDIVIYGYDMDCDDSYFNPKRDGMVYPDSTSVVPFEGIPFWYIDKSVDLVKTPDGYKMTSKPLECEDEELAALQLINRIRVDAGIHAVFLNKELSAKCRKHAHYVAVNGADQIDTPYQENAGNDGYTPEGASIAAGSIYWYFDKASDAIQAHMGYIFYRNRYVHGNRRTIGIGYDSPVFCFNESNLDNDPPRYEYPIRIPGPGQKIPYIHFSTHSATFQPDPRPGASGCGFPITLTWDYASNVELKDAKLFLVKGEKEIAQQIASSGPNKPAVPNYYQNNQGMIAIIPLNTLEPKATYRVVIDYTDGGEEKNIDYYFTTANVAKN